MELFNGALKYTSLLYTKIENSTTYTMCVSVVLFAPSHFAAGFCAQNSVDYRSNLCRKQNYLLFKLLRVIYLT